MEFNGLRVEERGELLFALMSDLGRLSGLHLESLHPPDMDLIEHATGIPVEDWVAVPRRKNNVVFSYYHADDQERGIYYRVYIRPVLRSKDAKQTD